MQNAATRCSLFWFLSHFIYFNKLTKYPFAWMQHSIQFVINHRCVCARKTIRYWYAYKKYMLMCLHYVPLLFVEFRLSWEILCFDWFDSNYRYCIGILVELVNWRRIEMLFLRYASVNIDQDMLQCSMTQCIPIPIYLIIAEQNVMIKYIVQMSIAIQYYSRQCQ